MRILNIVFAVFISLNTFAQFSPQELYPALWLDASDSSQMVLSGSKVIAWKDKSGNEFNAIAPSTTNQPVYLGSNLGISFDGIDDLLLSTDISKGNDDGITVFAVAKASTISGDEQLKKWIVSKGSWTGGAPYALMQNNGGMYAVVNGKSVKFRHDDMKMHILCLKYTGQAISGEIDGIEFPYSDVTPKSNSDKVGIGCDAAVKFPFKGVISEVLIFQRKLDECEISKVNGYLTHKWEETQLTKFHPFSAGPVDFCEGAGNLNVDENASVGTNLGIPQVVNVADSVAEINNWQISYQLFDGMFAVNKHTGELTVADNSNLDYELASSFTMKIKVETNAGFNETEFQVFLNNMEDGDVPKQTSLLWGAEGENWDPRGRLPDFSFAGYNSGESDIPTFTNEIEVADHGVVVNDENSDVIAIQKVIDEAPDNTTIFFPAGKYIIDVPLIIERSNIIIKGVSDTIGGTIFYMPKSATEYYGSFKDGYSTGGEGYFVSFEGSYDGTKCKIIEDVKRGDRTITVDNISSLEADQIVCITGTGDNPQNGELWHELHNNQIVDWDCTLVWASGNGGPMYHTIERIEGNLITLREPLKINMKAKWEMAVQQANRRLFNVGIENIKIDFPETEKNPHLEEPGYNGINFKACANFWARNINISNSDNGINVKRSTYGEIFDIILSGREGHHGISFSYSSNNIAHNINFQNTDKWVHSVTFTHKANGNVLYDVKGTKAVSLDYHRNAPFSNLICDVRTEWNYQSSGTYCAGPHAGARNVYWNLFGEADEIRSGSEMWGQYQNTLVSSLSIDEILHPEQEWYENIENVTPANLYLSQLNRRLTATEEPLFVENEEIGNRSNWIERDPSRWRIEEIDGELFYSLFVNDFPSLSGGKPGEYAIYDSEISGNFNISTNVTCRDNFIDNSGADILLIADYIDDNNYIFGRISSNALESGIYRVKNGIAEEIESSGAVLPDNLAHTLSLKRAGNKTTLIFDNVEIASTNELASISNGRVGIGSSDDAVLFDDIEFNSSIVSANRINKFQGKPKVYPNPANGKVNITLVSNDQRAILYNANMQVVKTNIKESFDVSGLTSGIYYLEIRSDKSRFIERIIVQ